MLGGRAWGTCVGDMCRGHSWGTCVGDTLGGHVWGTHVGDTCGGHAWGTCLGDMHGGHAWGMCLGDHFSFELCLHKRCGGLTPSSKRCMHLIKTLNERLNISVVMSIEI